MVDIYDVAAAVKATLAAKHLPNTDMTKTPTDLFPPPSDALTQFVLLIQDCETGINNYCHMNFKWPVTLPDQAGQPFAKAYLTKSLNELISYFNAYINTQAGVGVS
jgi:hypothetical protein